MLAVATDAERRLSTMKLLCWFSLSWQVASTVSAEAAGKPPTPLEYLGRKTQVAATRASAAASDAWSASAETYSRLNAEASAKARRATVEETNKIALDTLTIKGGAVEAQKLAGMTGGAAAQAAAAVAAAKAGVKQAEASAAAHVAEEVDNELAHVFMDLQDWKMKVLHDPIKEASKAGMKAALPYEKALQTIEKRVSDYETRATGLSAQARGLRTVAAGLANGAVAKQAGGALKAAQQDMMNAHIMMGQAAAFEAQGIKLINQAHIWNVQIPTYVGAAAGAAHQKTWQYAKNAFAPPPVSFGLPPPTNVFLQKSSSDARASNPAV
jgi:hypothetical protein